MTAPLLPVRMLNEFVFCPRLFHFMFVQSEMEKNHFVVEGRDVHRRVDSGTGVMPGPEGPSVARSIELSSEVLGLTGKVDLVSVEGGALIPVDYKRGAPDGEGEAWPPDVVQLCAYAMLLRETGQLVERGRIYYASTKQNIEVVFDETVMQLTRDALAGARAHLQNLRLPPPLVNSRKCPGCSLNGICLPDETNLLNGLVAGEARPLVTRRDTGQPLVLLDPKVRLGISQETLEVRGAERKLVQQVPLGEVSHVVVQGQVQLTTQALGALLAEDIPVLFLSFGGWVRGIAEGLGHKNIELRRAQFRAADEPSRCLMFARTLVKNKILNQRTLLRRQGVEDRALSQLQTLATQAEAAPALDSLLGIEGTAARTHFEGLRTKLETGVSADFEKRRRRPPTDPVNAVMSYLSSLLVRDTVLAARIVGFDTFLGFYHQPHYGRPALALDLMEPFRPLIVDSTLLTLFNTNMLTEQSFVRSSHGCWLTDDARKVVIRAYERRASEEVTHPVFGYRATYRRVFELQARLLGRWLLGDVPNPPEFRTR